MLVPSTYAAEDFEQALAQIDTLRAAGKINEGEAARQFADHLEAWFDAGAAGGFTIMPPLLPQGLDAVVDLVVPEPHAARAPGPAPPRTPLDGIGACLA